MGTIFQTNESNGNTTITGSLTITPTTNQLVLGTTHTITIDSVAPAASEIYTIPDVGSAANFVLDHGNYTIAGTWTFNTAPTLSTALLVASGGTGLATLTAHNVMLGEGTSNVAFAAPGAANTALVSNGVSSDPTFQAIVNSIAGTINEITASSSTGSVTLSIPSTFVAPGSIAATTTLSGTSETLTNTTNQLTLGTTNTTTISSTAPSASRTITIPDAGANSNMVLDHGNYTIAGTWTFSNNITLASSKAIVFTDNTTNTVTMEATNSTTSYTLKLPTTSGTSGYFLQTDGSGVTSWQPGGSGTISSGTTGNVGYYTGTTTIGSSTITNTQLTYLPNLFSYRRPNLVYSSSTVVSVEIGLDGTSSDAVILFPDGNLRTETSSSRYNMTISQNAVFNNATLGSNQGGLRTGSATANTWYACYAVKVSTFTANWVLVADTVLPLQANFSTLNTNFGTNSWVYLGMIRYGDNASATTSILNFIQAGNRTIFYNNGSAPATGDVLAGTLLATGSSTTSLTWTNAQGTGTTQIPNNLTHLLVVLDKLAGASGSWGLDYGSSTPVIAGGGNATRSTVTVQEAVSSLRFTASNAVAVDLFLCGFTDIVLGVGSNPLI